MKTVEREVRLRLTPWERYIEALSQALALQTPEAWEAAQAAFDAARQPVVEPDETLVYYKIVVD
jgi:crotonobetainyl-CoA:carnitine CoA-transferase CaiB-like acyl-CoA transferase